MGMSPRAHLAYGYDLGTPEDFKAAERDEYGAPNLPWLTTDEDGDFGGLVEEKLLTAAGFTETDWRADGYFDRRYQAQKQVGVGLYHSGHVDSPGWVLIADGSKRTVDWAEVMLLDLDELEGRPCAEGWDIKLGDALSVLGITATQVRARWLVFPSYG